MEDYRLDFEINLSGIILQQILTPVKDLIKLPDGYATGEDYKLSKYHNLSNPCKFCNSIDIIKKGLRKNKTYNLQVFKCKTCGKKFSTTKE